MKNYVLLTYGVCELSNCLASITVKQYLRDCVV